MSSKELTPKAKVSTSDYTQFLNISHDLPFLT